MYYSDTDSAKSENKIQAKKKNRRSLDILHFKQHIKENLPKMENEGVLLWIILIQHRTFKQPQSE